MSKYAVYYSGFKTLNMYSFECGVDMQSQHLTCRYGMDMTARSLRVQNHVHDLII